MTKCPGVIIVHIVWTARTITTELFSCQAPCSLLSLMSKWRVKRGSATIGRSQMLEFDGFPSYKPPFPWGCFQLATFARGYAFCLCQRLPAKKGTTDSHGAMWKTPQEALMNRELLNWTRLIGWWMDGQLFVSHICIYVLYIYIYLHICIYCKKNAMFIYYIHIYIYIYKIYKKHTWNLLTTHVVPSSL